MSTTLSACACMGPQGKDPVCPCRMRAMGKEPASHWTEEDKQRLTEALGKIFEWDGVGYEIGTQEAHDAFVAKRQANCPHTEVEVTEHLTGEGAMEYVEWYDHICKVCGARTTTNDGENPEWH